MSTNNNLRIVLENTIQVLDLPKSVYEKAKDRYDDIGSWLNREKSTIKQHKPLIFPQGSFRLGTAIYPLDINSGYDLDLACELTEGVNVGNCTQKNLKQQIGHELESYRKYRNITNKLENKHRCWRIEYQDGLNFHIDIVPCIPADYGQKQLLHRLMLNNDIGKDIASSVSELTVFITDDRHKGYQVLCSDWKISNPLGY